MHIEQSHHTHKQKQAKCSKMTEDRHKKSGMNGIIDGGSGNVGALINHNPPRNESNRRTGAPGSTTQSGGRLKFFKDGKFILELARAREGERVSWVSVPRKTFWPPQATTASTPPTLRQESSTSLSVSDDNSSVQSSPWQRDHSWKQNTPRCNVSSEMTFLYSRPRGACIPRIRCIRRRPFDPSPSIQVKKEKCDSSVQSNRIVKIKSEQNDVSVSPQEATSSSDKLKNNKQRQSRKLNDIVKILWDKKPHINNYGAFKSVLLNNIRQDQIVSPRKRILRELERVTIDDLTNKRSRAKPAQSITFTPATGTSPNRAHNGTTETPSKNSSSYSITSLLGHRQDEESSSPNHNATGSQSEYVSSPSVSQRMNATPKNISYSSPKMLTLHDSPDLSPSPEHYRYIPHQNIIHNSPTHALSPPPDLHKLYRVGSNHYSPIQGMQMHQKSPQYYTPSHRAISSSPNSPRSPFEDRNREHTRCADSTKISPANRLLEMEHNLRPAYISPFMYSPNPSPYINHPGYYSPGSYRTPYQASYSGDPLTHPSSPQSRTFGTHPTWTHVSPNHSLDSLRDDIGSDVPLNLSKNGG